MFTAAQTLRGHTSYVYCTAQLDDGRLASGSNDNTLKVWE
jgi:WD40 repeat protein